MSLEQVIAENTAAVRELIAALAANGGAAASTTAPAADKEEKEEKAEKTTRTRRSAKTEESAPVSKYTAEQVKAAAVKVKDELGTAEAKKLIKSAGKADELAAIKPENYDAFIAACEAAINGEDDGGDGEDDL